MYKGKFSYVKYDDLAQKAQKKILEKVEELEDCIDTYLLDGRSSRLAITKLEECYMWIGKQIRDDQMNRDIEMDEAERSKKKEEVK